MNPQRCAATSHNNDALIYDASEAILWKKCHHQVLGGDGAPQTDAEVNT